MADELTDGRRFRTLTVVDVFTRECLEIEIGQSLKAEDVVRLITRLDERRCCSVSRNAAALHQPPSAKRGPWGAARRHVRSPLTGSEFQLDG